MSHIECAFSARSHVASIDLVVPATWPRTARTRSPAHVAKEEGWEDANALQALQYRMPHR